MRSPNRTLRFVAALCAAVAALAAGPSRATRYLVLAVDALPYDLMRDVSSGAGGGHRIFADFRPPRALVSTFPSATVTGFTGILEPLTGRRSPGYEARFFDIAANSPRGGGLISYHLIPFAWKEAFDWKLTSIFLKGLSYLTPGWVARREIAAVERAFLLSKAPIFVAYVNATDATLHMQGRAGLRPLLDDLDRMVRRLRERSPEPVEVVVFSDHGMSRPRPMVNRREEVERTLVAGGYRVGDGLDGPRDVVLVPVGLISAVAAWTRPVHRVRVAATLARARGVAFCAAPEEPGQRWILIGPGGRARIERRRQAGRSWYRYLVERGDVLALGPILGRLEGQDWTGSATGWHDESTWFEATVGHRFPDPLHRVARGFDLVENPASVLCSMAPGSYVGAGRTEFGAGLVPGEFLRTHGALDRDPSLGVLMTTIRGVRLPRALPFDRALAPFAEVFERWLPVGARQ